MECRDFSFHANPHNLYAVPREKSVARFKDQIRNLTQRRAPVTLRDMIEVINPIIRGGETITGRRMSQSCSIEPRMRVSTYMLMSSQTLISAAAKLRFENCFRMGATI